VSGHRRGVSGTPKQCLTLIYFIVSIDSINLNLKLPLRAKPTHRNVPRPKEPIVRIDLKRPNVKPSIHTWTFGRVAQEAGFYVGVVGVVLIAHVAGFTALQPIRASTIRSIDFPPSPLVSFTTFPNRSSFIAFSRSQILSIPPSCHLSH
jgi:hypothetical protein